MTTKIDTSIPGGHAYTDQAAHAHFPPIDSGPLYEDATYQYGAEAAVGTELTATEWLVWRRKLDDQRIEYASVNYEFAYTDLATAQAAFV